MRQVLSVAVGLWALLLLDQSHAGAQFPEDKAGDALAAALEEAPDLNKMRAPESPAFVILGETAAQIQRPQNVSQLVTTIGSALSESATGPMPIGFAAEVAPYWLVPRYGLDFERYNRESWASVWRTLALSAGTKVGTSADDGGRSFSDLAVGLRSQILRGQPPKQCLDAIEALRTIGEELTREVTLPGDILMELKEKYGFGTLEFREAVREWQDKRVKNYNTKLPDIYSACESAGRRGFAFEAAAAASWRFPDADATRGELRRGGAWLTASLVAERFSVSMLGRFEAIETPSASNRAIDGGARVTFQRESFALSAEFIARRVFLGEVSTHFRVVGIAETRVSRESWVSLGVGRDDLVSRDGSLVASLNLRLSFGKPVLGRQK